MARLFGTLSFEGEVVRSVLLKTFSARTQYDDKVVCILSLEQLAVSDVKVKGSPYSITEHRVPELIPVLGSQPAGDVSHKPGGRLPLLSARPAVTPATLKRAATNFAAW